MMDLYVTIESFFVSLAIGLMGFRLVKDELTLRHKSMLAKK